MNRVVVRGARPPLLPILRWQQPDRPLPRRPVRLPARWRGRTVGLEAPPWLVSGDAGRPFDFCGMVRALCDDIARRTEELRHIDVNRLLFGITQARCGARHGLQARLTPLRLRGGALDRVRDGVRYRLQRYIVDGRDLLYLVTFCLPRFLDQTFDEKFITLFHELYHISPAFDGDFRRLGTSCALHSRSKREYDAHMAALARGYLASGADPNLHAFFRMDFAQLAHRHGSVVGVVVPRPRLLPLPNQPDE